MVRAIVAALLIAVAGPAFAQSQDPPRVGAIRMSYVARTSKAGQSALAEIEKFVKAKEVEAVQASKRSRREFERFQEDARADIQALQLKFDSEFRVKLSPIVNAISQERGLHFVFGLEEAAIVWWSPAADISEEVVKRLDAGK
jgi:Skp family chaperone for outer membrane proteins